MVNKNTLAISLMTLASLSCSIINTLARQNPQSRLVNEFTKYRNAVNSLDNRYLSNFQKLAAEEKKLSKNAFKRYKHKNTLHRIRREKRLFAEHYILNNKQYETDCKAKTNIGTFKSKFARFDIRNASANEMNNFAADLVANKMFLDKFVNLPKNSLLTNA